MSVAEVSLSSKNTEAPVGTDETTSNPVLSIVPSRKFGLNPLAQKIAARPINPSNIITEMLNIILFYAKKTIKKAAREFKLYQ